MAYLILVRHGQSEWNALGLWTGWTDVSLTEEGKVEARKAAENLKDITLHRAYTSKLKRTQETLHEIQEALSHTELETTEHAELNERHYGDFTGKNKWQVREEVGEEKFTKLRRSWDHPIPNGETMKAVHDRAVPFYEQHILEDLKQGKNVIVAGHGNTLRALMKHLENVPEDKIHEVEIGTGGVIMYEIDDAGNVKSKHVLADTTAP